jgi:hypothetical protein
MSGSPVAGATVTVSPSVQGVSGITTDASGNYSVVLPNGNYTLTFAKNGFTSQTTGTINVVATKTVTSNITLVPNAGATVNAGADRTGLAFGASVALSASVEVYDPSLTGTPTFLWTQVVDPSLPPTVPPGPPVLPLITINDATVATPIVTLASSSVFKDNLVRANAVRSGVVVELLPPEVPGESPATHEKPIMEILNRFMVQPINPFSLEEGGKVTLQVAVTINGQTFTDTVNLSVNPPFVPTTGLRNVPIGQPVLLHGKTQASYSWAFSAKPAGSTATLNDAASQNPDFIPDVAGQYTITEATSATSLDLYAGTWVGVILPDGTPDSACLGCHNGTTAPDKFTPWKSSGHAFILTNNINDPAGHWSATSCGPCHTVGYNQFATTIQNGGWDQISKVEGFKFTQGPLAWTQTLANYPKTAKLSNIQCENCHGPQAGGGAHTLVSPRVDIASSQCAYCHGEPSRHGRFQEWAESAHGDFETAINEGFSTATTGVTTIRTSCAGCHTGQGFLQWYKQLANVGGSRGVGSRTLDATTLANLGWNSTGALTSSGATVIQDAAVPGVVTKANVQPQTCAVCHDPHDEGTVTTTVPGGINDARVRIKDNTSLLPGGFIATGVGRGAQCITCHNSRNGERTSGGGNPTLHEDGDANFGTNTGYTVVAAGLPNEGEHAAYNAPHEAAQGDVLMGRNAYFISGLRSKHSFLADTCATCHMQLTTPPPAFSGGGAFGTNHGFKPSTDICTKCHGSYNGGTIQTSFDASLAQLATEITNAVYKLKNGGAATPPATFVLYFGRSFQYSLDGGTTKANVGSSYNSTTGVRTDGYLTGVTAGVPATDPNEGYNAVIAKANWNYSLVQLDLSKGIHNPSFTFQVIDQTKAQVKALAASLP